MGLVSNLDKVARRIYNINMQNLELPQPLQFEWDSGNQNKNLRKHGVTNDEAEEVFINLNLIWADIKHSGIEQRFNILGKSNNGKLIFSCYTLRDNKIRIISSRPASRKERNAYEKTL